MHLALAIAFGVLNAASQKGEPGAAAATAADTVLLLFRYLSNGGGSLKL